MRYDQHKGLHSCRRRQVDCRTRDLTQCFKSLVNGSLLAVWLRQTRSSHHASASYMAMHGGDIGESQTYERVGLEVHPGYRMCYGWLGHRRQSGELGADVERGRPERYGTKGETWLKKRRERCPLSSSARQCTMTDMVVRGKPRARRVA